MKISCKIIEDLLPLYVDGDCSEESRILVTEHLVECMECSKKCDAMHMKLIPEVVAEEDSPRLLDNEKEEGKQRAHDLQAKKVLMKLKRRWIAYMVMILAMIPVILLSANQYRGEGLSFTNLYDYFCAGQFIRAVQQEEFERAFTYIDVNYFYQETQRDGSDFTILRREDFQLVTYADGSRYYTNGKISVPESEADLVFNEEEQLKAIQQELEWLEQFKGVTFEEFYEMKKKDFIEDMSKWAANGYSVERYRYFNSYRIIADQGDSYTQFDYNIYFTDNKDLQQMSMITLMGNGKGKFRFNGGFYEVNSEK
jgi:hypothetical protein